MSTIQTSTLENLQAAFNGESNASAKYAKFAVKAQEEGYLKAAALFRAASRAEAIHAKGLAAVIKKMGAEPKADIHEPEIKSTFENLAVARDGEIYERDVMYPEFIEKAKADGSRDALRIFEYAMAAEAEHAVLYEEARTHLQEWEAAGDFFVCPLCGKTVSFINFDKCSVCNIGADKFEKIS